MDLPNYDCWKLANPEDEDREIEEREEEYEPMDYEDRRPF